MISVTRVLRGRLRGGDGSGFSLLALVALLFGVLSALLQPGGGGASTNAAEASTESDLGNAKIAVIAYFTANPTVTTAPALDMQSLGAYGLTQSSDTVSMAYVAGVGSYSLPTSPAAQFCIEAVSSTSAVFSVSNSGGIVRNGSCEGS